MSEPMKVLVVDDDHVTRELVSGLLRSEDFDVQQAENAESALQMVHKTPYPILFSDIQMMGMGGLELLEEVKKADPTNVVVLMTGFGSLESAMTAIQRGAFDYLSKPLNPVEVKTLATRARDHWRSLQKREGERQPVAAVMPRTLIGRSPQMVQVYKMLAKASMSTSNVLIQGESGTGKELVARAVHDNSPLRDKRFVTVNCSALAETLLESELFGHVKGAFTGAISNKAGLFEEAHGGTIFLDEIGDISLALQVKLLRVIQEGEFKPVGASETRKVNVRVLSATHRNLEEAVRNNQFREDLYYRLKVLQIELPPLRDRLDDLQSLVTHFLGKFASKQNKPVSHFSPEAMELFRQYRWPGNIRELEHAVEWAVAVTSTNVIYPEDLPVSVINASGSNAQVAARPTDLDPLEGTGLISLEEVEKRHILRVLEAVRFNRSKAADVLGIDRATLYRKAQRYGISFGEDNLHAKPFRG